ncbi:hypothetical protein Geoth_1121 [Parageobacillus thermoglucosidasius C56-YS93]|nr:hypothetical protein Geoth_1121 [Parageobacillus thermoglucosidasius C56-YS93]
MKTKKSSVHLNCGVMHMNEQNQSTTEQTTIEQSITEQSPTDQSTINQSTADQSTISNLDFVDMREHTLIETKEGNIAVIHEITLGDVIISVILAAMLIFMVLERFMRR